MPPAWRGEYSKRKAAGKPVVPGLLRPAASRITYESRADFRISSSRYFWKNAAFFGMYSFHFSGVSSSAKMASTGQAGTQAPQSMHSSG